MKKSPNASNDGRYFQDTLTAVFDEYERLGIASIKKTEPPMRVVGGGKFRRVIFLANPWLDYAGTTNLGRAVIIEAKSTSKPRLGIDSNEAAGIKTHQRETALRWQNMGAVAFYLWHWTDGIREGVRLLTPTIVENALRRGVRSVTWDDALRIPRGAGRLIFDPLAAYTAAQTPTT